MLNFKSYIEEHIKIVIITQILEFLKSENARKLQCQG